MLCLKKSQGQSLIQRSIIIYDLLNLQRRCLSTGKQHTKRSVGFFFHFSDSPFNLATLTSRITNSELLQSSNQPANLNNIEGLLIEAIQSCKALHLKTYKTNGQIKSSKSQDTHDLKLALVRSKRFSSPLDLLSAVLDHNASNLTYKSLHTFLVTRPYPPTHQAISLLSRFESTSWAISAVKYKHEMVYIALRRALLRRELALAYELVDIINSDTLSTDKKRTLILGGSTNKHALLSASSLSIMGGGAIITGAYLLALPPSITFGTLVALGMTQLALYLRAISSGSRVRWRPGIFLPIFTRLKQQHELQMINRIAVGYDELVDLTVDNYHHLATSTSTTSPDSSVNLQALQDRQQQQLTKNKMRLVETDQERMFNEYWTRAGEGFAWVEPDQDPSDNIVRNIRQKA